MLGSPASSKYPPAAIQFQLRGDLARTRELAEAVIELSTEHGMAQDLVWGRTYRGWALARQGKVEQGIGEMRASLAAHDAMGSRIARPHFLALLSQALGRAGRVDEAKAALAEAWASAQSTGEHCYDAEICRLRGELAQMQDAAAEAENCFREAMTISMRQSARSLELRAVMSLSRLSLARSKRAEGRSMLAETYGRFTEGFDTADLQEAKALLEELQGLEHED